LAPVRTFAGTVADLLAARRAVVLVYVVRSSDPQLFPAGAKVVCPDGGAPEVFGLGESEAAALCAHLPETDRSDAPGVIDVRWSDSPRPVEVSLYRERLQPPLQCIVAGAGHVGTVLVDIGRALGWSVVVVDDRSDFADPARFPGDVDVVCDPFERVWRRLTIDAATAVVLLTRGHRHDQTCLRALVGTEPFYIGMIGSRRRARKVLVELRDDGVSQEFIRRVFTPVGLPLATETPAEIALAVAGEIVAAWRGRGDWARQQKDAYYERTRRHESGTR